KTPRGFLAVLRRRLPRNARGDGDSRGGKLPAGGRRVAGIDSGAERLRRVGGGRSRNSRNFGLLSPAVADSGIFLRKPPCRNLFRVLSFPSPFGAACRQGERFERAKTPAVFGTLRVEESE